jgi:hypothetical protein
MWPTTPSFRSLQRHDIVLLNITALSYRYQSACPIIRDAELDFEGILAVRTNLFCTLLGGENVGSWYTARHTLNYAYPASL